MIPGKAWSEAKGTKNRKALRRIVRAGKRPGVLAYYGGEAIGWCAVAPRADYPRLARSRVLKPVDDRAVWSITCLFIQRSYRRKGVSSRLIRAAAEFAGKRGARIIEGYPIVSTMAKTPDPFIWTGVPSAFKRAGFKEVARRSKTRPIMRTTKRRSSR